MKLIYLFIFLLLTISSRTQIHYVDVKVFGEAEGFTGGEISTISQDRKGFIWISTRSGLFRFNGTSFRHYKHVSSDSNSLPVNTVSFCYQDKDGDYWIGFPKIGLYRYDDRTEKFYPWKNSNVGEIDLSRLYNPLAAFEDSHGRLWISAATQGIVLINKKEKTAKLFNVCDQKDPVDLYRSCLWVNHFAEDPDGKFWLFSNNGLIHFDPKDGSFVVNRNLGLTTSFLKDRDKKYWIGTWAGGLKNLDPVTGKIKSYYWAPQTPGTTNIMAGIEEKDADHIWISSVDAGLLIFQKSTGTFTKAWSQRSNENFLGSTTQMLRDSIGNVWLLAQQKLMRINANNIFQYEYIGNPDLKRSKAITSFLRLPGDSLVFIGAIYTREGLHIYNLNTKQISLIRLSNNGQNEDVKEFFADSKQQIWICTNNGLYLLDRKTLKADLFVPPSKNYKNYFSESFEKVAEDNRHRLWLAMRWAGLFCYDPEQNTIVHYSVDSPGKYHIPFNHIEYLAIDNNQNVWLGTHPYLKEQPPVFCITTSGEIRSYDKKIPLDAISQIVVSNNELLISTSQSGLFKISKPLQPTEHIQSFTEDNGLANGFIEGFAEDHSGNIWVTTHNGLSCLTPKGFVNFHMNDGLANNYLEGRPYYDSEGNLFLPYEDGFQYFRADSLLSWHQPVGPVILEGLSINQKSYPGDLNHLSKLDLPYDQNNLSLEFAAFDLSQGDKLQYSYKLEGSDTVWNNLGRTRHLLFSTLSPGHYKLKLRADDRFGNSSVTEFVLPIIIHPPFWNRWWFYGICLLAAIVVGYIIYRVRINTLLAEQKLRNKIARDLHDDIGSTLSGIKLFSNMAQSKLIQEQSEATAIVERIGERSEKMIEAMSDIVWSINPINDSVENMLVRMKQYAAEMLEPKNIAYQFIADEKVARMKTGLESRKDIYLVYKESINNAVKHSNCRNLFIHLTLDRKLFEMTISDDGVGFVQPNGNGNGLENLKERAKNIGGKIKMESFDGKGTTIKLSVPVT